MTIFKVPTLDGPLGGTYLRIEHRPLDGEEAFITQDHPDAPNYRSFLYEFSERRKGFYFIRQLEGPPKPLGAY